jgi:predicted DNA repair protein MutK
MSERIEPEYAGAGITIHGVPLLAAFTHSLEQVSFANDQLKLVLKVLLPSLFSALVGIVSGSILLMAQKLS